MFVEELEYLTRKMSFEECWVAQPDRFFLTALFSYINDRFGM